MRLTSDMTDMIGTPFEELKCWDVVAEVYRRNGVMDEWQEVKEPTEGSVLVFSLKGKELDHVGVYLGDGRFIHATKPSGVCIEHISKYVPRLKHIYDRKE